MTYYAVQMHDGELYHHGILGMKWGKRQGPPYPLDASDHSSAEKKAGWRKSLGATVQKLGQSNVNRATSKARAKQAYKSGKIDKAEYKQKLKDADEKNRQEHKDALGISKAEQKMATRSQERANRKEAKDQSNKPYKDVDPNVAKNKQTKRVALDYHNLSDRKFRQKYKTSKEKFAKRYEKSKGDTFTMGKKKAIRSAMIMAMSPDVHYVDLKTGKLKTVNMGASAAAKTLAKDFGYSKFTTDFGYRRAEKKYNRNN